MKKEPKKPPNIPKCPICEENMLDYGEYFKCKNCAKIVVKKE